jgi:LysM domain
MSAMRAEELPELPVLPELPAALPQDSAQTRAAVRWTAPLDPPAPGSPPHHDTPHEQPTPRHDTPHEQPTPRHDTPRELLTPRPRSTRPQTANPPLRLTRRGRVVVAVAAALVLAALSLVIASAALAASHPVSSRAAQQGLAQVAVRPGQSLWSVAEDADPGADTRVVIQRIIDLNGLTGNVVFAGQRLWVPRG